MHAGFQALRSRMPMNMRRVSSGVERSPELDVDLRRVQELWREALERWDGPYLFGAFSLADCFFAPVVSRFRTYGVELEGAAEAYAERIEAWPAYRRWREAALAEPWSMPKYDL
jgi:glutathione S-transferase